MDNVIIFGAGGTGQRIFSMINEDVNVIAFCDNDSNKWGKEVCGKEILSPNEMCNKMFDKVIVGTLMGLGDVEKQLDELGIDLGKLDKTYCMISVKAREIFIKRFAEMYKKTNAHCGGAVAECGVFRGEFAREINRYFPEHVCYLFDTFSGFDARDFEYEKMPSMTTGVDHLMETSEDIVLSKMPNKENVIIKKGYFPDSINGLENEFIFVNLDMDLYKPTIEGLKYFYPRMKPGGCILIHDYFTEIFPNIENAVNDFEQVAGIHLHKIPIGDDISLAIIK